MKTYRTIVVGMRLTGGRSESITPAEADKSMAERIFTAVKQDAFRSLRTGSATLKETGDDGVAEDIAHVEW